METKTPIRLTLALVMAMTVLGMTARSSITYQATYHQSEVTLGTDTLGGVTYSTVSYHGLYNDGAPGAPSLPVDYIKFSVPYNATNFSVSTTVSSSYSMYPNQLLYPCQPLRMMNDTTPLITTLPDSAIYYSNTNYPSQRAWVVDEGFLAGENHIVTVAVMPWYYKHYTRAGMMDVLKLYRTVNLTLSYDLGGSMAMYPIVRNDTTLRIEGYRLTQEIVANPGNVQSNAPQIPTLFDPDPPFIQPDGDGLNGGGTPSEPRDSTGMFPDPGGNGHYGGDLSTESYPYLIVTTSDLLQSTKRLAALKRQKGYNVKVVTMDEVLNSPFAEDGDRIKISNDSVFLAFSDEAGKLRQYLKYFYANYGTDYVLLAGHGVPYRYSTYPPYAPTDMYFTDFQTNFRTQKYDKEPEICTGRLLAKEPNQINNYTDKLLRYELNPGHGEATYLKRAMYTECTDLWGTSHLIGQILYPFFSDTIIIKENNNHNYPKGLDIINEINATQYGFMSFHNHGEPSSIAVSGGNTNPYNLIWTLDSVHVSLVGSINYNGCSSLNLMNNKWKPSILYSIACNTMPFDTLVHYENIPMSFGESFTTGKDYGGPAFLGNTRGGAILCAHELEEIFAQQIVSGFYKIGQAEAFSKANYGINQVNTTHNLLGDPEFEIWTDSPSEFSNISILRTDDSIRVSGIGSTSAYVAFYNNGGSACRRLSNTGTVTFNNVSPNSTIMVYRHNSIPYIAPLLLQNTTLNRSQYIFASDVVAGSFIDSGRTSGDVIVKNGIEYEIEASGTVTLQDGFKVEKGATFAVYPSCF